MEFTFLIYFLIILFFFFQWFVSHTSKERLSRTYKDKFRLNRREIKQLNKQLPFLRQQLYIEFCIEEVIRFYLIVFRELSVQQQRNFNLSSNLMHYAICLIKQNYDYQPATTEQLLTLRNNFSSEELILIEKHAQSVTPLNDEKEKRLYASDNQRWKRHFDTLTTAFESNNPAHFYGEVVRLASLNRSVRLVDTRNIFYKGYLFMVEHHKATSLKLYMHYLDVKSASGTFKHKQISARNMAKLFAGKEQQTKFDIIRQQYLTKGNLDKALAEIDLLYVPVRRKINLHIDQIQEANARQTKVAQLLSIYLDDEPVTKAPSEACYITEQQTSNDNHQKALFDLFISNAFRLNQQEVHIFAQTRGLFKDQFIESVNEQYYEALDDLLIEEEEEEYILNEEYYMQVVSQ